MIERFRAVALERLERLEAAWAKLTSEPHDAATAAILERELHTLKGEARMVGFVDVDLVAHKLEDILDVCRELSISDDVDLVVTMALRFMTMLIRKKAGQTLGGIDLPGFVRQLDTVAKETRKQHPLRGRIATSTLPQRELFSGKVRDRLAGVALDLFLELASGRESKRIRHAWQQLRDSLSPADPELLAPILAKHETGARELAHALGKLVTFEFLLDAEARAPASIIKTLDLAALHLIRNAIDHGIERAEDRIAAGKPADGMIRVRCIVEEGRVVLEIDDDGCGIDFPSVRASGIELGLLKPDATPTDAELSKLLFHPGLTTRKQATSVSGRGIGLDAVHGQVSAVGGDVQVASEPGRGTSWTIAVPSPLRRFRVLQFTVRGTQIPCCVPADWAIEVEGAANDTIDLVEELGIGQATANPYTFELTRGDSIVRIGAASEPLETEARWLVATGAESLAGVASIEGVECLVLKPEMLVASTGKVAIVDDSEIIRELVRFSLQPYGIEVSSFEDPSALVGTLAANPVQLVLLDLSFKGVDIPQLVRRIKSALPDCAVYLHSDRTPLELARIAETAAADGYLAKALGREQFVTRVLKILRRR